MENLKNRRGDAKRETRLACASILIGAALWGIIGVWNRGLMAAGLSPVEIVAVRNCGGMLLLSLLFAARDRSVFRVKREHWKYFAGTGVISVALFTVCYFSCQRVCSLAVASILLYTAPSFVVLLSALLWKEPLTKRKAAALFLTLAGCASVCGVLESLCSASPASLFSASPADSALTATLPGILLGLGAGFFYALYSIFGRYALAHYSPMTVTVWTFLFAGPASLLFLCLSRLFSHAGQPPFAGTLSPSTLPLALGLAVFSTVLPYLFYTRGLAKLEAGKASILASLEPVVASLAGVACFHEPANLWTVCGIGLVLAGVWILR